MSKLQSINWHEEALRFFKKHGVHPSTISLGMIELSMRHAALLIVDGFAVEIKSVNDDLEKRRKDSATTTQTKVIML